MDQFGYALSCMLILHLLYIFPFVSNVLLSMLISSFLYLSALILLGFLIELFCQLIIKSLDTARRINWTHRKLQEIEFEQFLHELALYFDLSDSAIFVGRVRDSNVLVTSDETIKDLMELIRTLDRKIARKTSSTLKGEKLMKNPEFFINLAVNLE